MKDPSQEDLLGYVLGALDADQHHEIQQKIDQDPQLDERLLEIKSQLVPLEMLNEEADGMRPGLARRTCELVANGTVQPKSTIVEPAFSDSISERSYSRTSSWMLKDFLVAAACVAIFASLLMPVLSYTKQQANIVDCGNNLRSIGMALASFSETNDGRFVEIPSEGPFSFSGIVAPMLKEAQVIEDDNWFTCKGVNRDKPFMIPSTDQIRRCSTGDQSDYFRRISSGDYGYSFGHMEGDQYVSPRNLGRSYVIIAADKPSTRSVDGPSENHGGKGQNCLFEDIHVRFVKGNSNGEDLIYVNAYNVVGPGVCPRDSVIGASHLSPLGAISARQVMFSTE